MEILGKMQRMNTARTFVWAAVALALPLGACTEVESKESFSYGAWGVYQLRADLTAGSLDYSGDGADALSGEIRNWATGLNETAANRRLQTVLSSFSVQDGQAIASAVLEDPEHTGVDFKVAGPVYLDTILAAEGGALHIRSVSGQHQWRAQRVSGTDIEGDFSLVTEGGEVALSLLPLPGGEVDIEAVGGVLDLALPYGLSYDLQVWGSSDSFITVSGLGLEKFSQEDGFFAGRTGDGTIRVRIDMTGGSAYLKSR
jgi:hypothetical protein